MKKLLIIGLKDIRLILRDRTAVVMMFLAPFLLTLGLGVVTGRFSGATSAGIRHIPVTIVNNDDGPLGAALRGLFDAPELADLVAVTDNADIERARAYVDAGKADAAIIVPSRFSESVSASTDASESNPAKRIEFYTNPTTPERVGVIRSILDQFLLTAEAGRIIVSAAGTHPVSSPASVEQVRVTTPDQMSSALYPGPIHEAVTLATVAGSGMADFDALAVFAPGMALMFLMYTTTFGGRVLLTEQHSGTLPRLLVSPTTRMQVLGGKLLGTFLTGVAQVLLLIVATSVLFHLAWGDWPALLMLTLSAVFAAVGWGSLLASVARTPSQISHLGIAIMLVFGLLGGTFFSMDAAPGWLQLVSKITPVAWGVEGFGALAAGGGLTAIWTSLLALLAMGIVLFAAAVGCFRRRGAATR